MGTLGYESCRFVRAAMRFIHNENLICLVKWGEAVGNQNDSPLMILAAGSKQITQQRIGSFRI